MIKDIVEAVNLRAPTILFIDDNPMNLNEAVYFVPGLQIASPDFISKIKDDSRFVGKADPQMERLGRYKVLEQKSEDQKKSAGDNIEFLRKSQIKVSFHYDVVEQFPRIHDLVNRTNQLNFTKNRWPEDEAKAFEVFQKEASERFSTTTGYVKVADCYGNYGICGFFMVREHACNHFAFSCRTMSMGVEQFVWNRLRNPHVHVVGDVISSLHSVNPDWIEIVDDVDALGATESDQSSKKLKICLRGGCDFTSMEHYFRTKHDVIGEFPFAFKTWAITPWARTVALAEGASTPRGQELLKKIAVLPDNYLNSSIHTGEADVYVLSFSVEYACRLYRSRSTGIIFPLYSDFLVSHHFNESSYQQITEKLGREPDFTPDEWRFMQDEFEFLCERDPEIFVADICKIFEKLKGKLVIVLVLNERVGRSDWIKGVYAQINRLVVPLAKTYGCHLVDYADLVHTENDLVTPDDHGVHYSREVYLKMAHKILDICTKYKDGTL